MKKGQTLLELIIGIGIFLISVSSLIFLIFNSYITGNIAHEITKAILLAEEGIEATISIRNNNFGDLTEGSHGLTISDGTWIFQGNQEDISDQLREGKRFIEVENIDLNRKKVTSRIIWQPQQGKFEEVKLITWLTNWQKVSSLPLVAMKTRINGYFYVPEIDVDVLKVDRLFDDPGLEGDQAGASNTYPYVPDGKVDIIDINFINSHFGQSEGDAEWEYMADVNGDKKVDITDIAIASDNFGNFGTYIYELDGVAIDFNVGADCSTLNPDGTCNIPPSARSFRVLKNGVPIGAYILFYSSGP